MNNQTDPKKLQGRGLVTNGSVTQGSQSEVDEEVPVNAMIVNDTTPVLNVNTPQSVHYINYQAMTTESIMDSQ